jgi:hypothetical protein
MTNREISALLDKICKYQIGDLVTLKQIESTWLMTPKEGHAAFCGRITHRLVEQCYGGVQIHYAVSFPLSDQGPRRYSEPEIVPYFEWVHALGDNRDTGGEEFRKALNDVREQQEATLKRIAEFENEAKKEGE